MKAKLIFGSIIFLILIIISCSGNDDNGEVISGDMMEENNNTVLKGSFISEAHTTTGTASINGARTELTFTNFMTDDGPLLEVWLSIQRTPSTSDTYISLGILQGISGNYTYTLPNNIDYANFNHVVIWCVQASVSFGYAVIE